jgi:hypothetical protein
MDAERRAMAVVFLVGVVSLAYELTQVRMLAFFLGNSMDFLAIPIALLGLAIGSMYRHFAYRGDSAVLVQGLSAALLPTMAVSLVAFFAVSNAFFDQIHVSLANPSTDALRLVVYALIFLPPYVIFGALFATLFSDWSHRIGRLYFFDLAGAALGCVLAPMLLTFTDLWSTLVVVLVGALGLLWVGGPPTVPVRASAVIGTLVVGALAAGGLVFHEDPNPMALGRTVARDANRVDVVDVEWNEIARTALLRARFGKGRVGLSIVQDNGLSNVSVLPYRPERSRDSVYEAEWQRRFAWALGMEPKSVLVIFAGAGRDMIAFDKLADGQADVVGVELNPTVVDWAHHPKLAHMKLGEFVDKPNIHLVNAEGRDFLNRDDRTYDLIYVANNGAVHTSRTGHTRKFLDTYEAMGAYLDHLSEDGLIIFMNQPVTEKLASFRRLFEERGLGDPMQSMYGFGWKNVPEMLDTLVVKRGGFSEADLDVLDAEVQRHADEVMVLYSPRAMVHPRWSPGMDGSLAGMRMVSDDQPFTHSLELGSLRMVPSEAQLKDRRYVSSWVKAFTIGFFALASLAVGAAAMFAGGAAARVPPLWFAYLLTSGVGYMCVEIGLIAKTELFVGNPLYAVALNLAVFLIANAVGALLQDNIGLMRSGTWLIGATLVSVAWGVGAVEVLNATLLSMPLMLKAVGVLIAVFPAGLVLGTFYPYCVAQLVAAGKGPTVPMTYGLTTLASVLGSSFAMTAIIDLGFSRVIAIGAVCYVAAGVLALAARR